MNNDDFFNFLVATDQVDEFLGYELPWEIKEQIKEIAINYKTEKITAEEVQEALRKIELKKMINYNVLYDYFQELL